MRYDYVTPSMIRDEGGNTTGVTKKYLVKAVDLWNQRLKIIDDDDDVSSKPVIGRSRFGYG
jgi:hypothetical protein